MQAEPEVQGEMGEMGEMAETEEMEETGARGESVLRDGAADQPVAVAGGEGAAGAAAEELTWPGFVSSLAGLI